LGRVSRPDRLLLGRIFLLFLPQLFSGDNANLIRPLLPGSLHAPRAFRIFGGEVRHLSPVLPKIVQHPWLEKFGYEFPVTFAIGAATGVLPCANYRWSWDTFGNRMHQMGSNQTITECQSGEWLDGGR
jgi:hypothetical protein